MIAADSEPAADSGGSVISVIDLDAAAIAEAPFLGFQIGEIPGAEPPSRVRVARPWIASLASPVAIDVEMFAEVNPFDEILGQGATTSTVISSVSAELSEHWDRPGGLESETPIPGVVISGGGLKALVWAHGMVIAAADPLATALNLLLAGFSPEARITHVRANPDKLRSALDVLPATVKREYAPDAAAFMTQASQEHVVEAHRVAQSRQDYINSLPRTQVRVVNGKVILTRMNYPPDE